MARIRSPRRPFVIALIVRQLTVFSSSQIMNPDVVMSAGALPGKSDELSVRRPGRIFGVAPFVDDPFDVGTVGIHHVNLLRTAAVRNKRDLPSCFGIP